MTLHHCGTFSTDTYCTCYNQRGVYKEHFKQFNPERQTYHCCDQINVSLSELRDYDPSCPGCSINPSSSYEFFSTLYNRKLTGCCFHDYYVTSEGTTSELHFSTNYRGLFNNYLAVKLLYNTFVADQAVPSTAIPNHVTCEGTNYPYILEYRSPDQVYNNNAFICSPQNNDVFQVLEAGYGRVNYNIKRFWNFSTNKPCVESSCQLKIDNYGNIANQGNQQASYKNLAEEVKTGSIVSFWLAAGILILWIFAGLWKHRNA